jgi:aspartate aminotransferase-like enzyme
MDRPEIILAPGPTPIPPQVLLAQGSPLVYHRGPGFGSLMRDVAGRLRDLYGTAGDVLLMTSSGTGGLESAIQNVFSPGDEVRSESIR